MVNPSNANIVYIATGDGDAADNYSVGVIETLAENLISEGKDFDQIIKTLNQKFPAEKSLITDVTNNLSAVIAYYEIERNKKSASKIYFAFAWLLIVFSLFYTVASFFKGKHVFVIEFGLLFAGLYLIFKYWNKIRQPIQPYQKKSAEKQLIRRRF